MKLVAGVVIEQVHDPAKRFPATDGGTHTLRFESNNAASANSTNIHLDDISIVADTMFGNGFE